MKKIIILFIILIMANLGVAQNADSLKLSKNSIIVTPLGDLLNKSKSSIYFRRVFQGDSEKYLSLRLGSEFFNSIDNNYSNETNDKTSAWNIKAGLEWGKKINKVVAYFGPEISYSTVKINDATLAPTSEAIFSTNSVVASEWNFIDQTTLSIFSLVGFFGFRYELTGSLFVGVESAIGFGWYSAKQEYDNNFSTADINKGTIKDLAANRFITLEYKF